MAESRELKSALLTKEVLSVEAGIEIDFRMIESRLAFGTQPSSRGVQCHDRSRRVQAFEVHCGGG